MIYPEHTPIIPACKTDASNTNVNELNPLISEPLRYHLITCINERETNKNIKASRLREEQIIIFIGPNEIRPTDTIFALMLTS